MAISAIPSVSGGYPRLLRTLPAAEGDVSAGSRIAPDPRAFSEAAARIEAASSPDAAASAAAPREAGSSAVLDERALTERSERLKLERGGAERSLEERVNLASLQARDAEVRMHEAAHVAAGDGYVIGGANFTYQIGPDGRPYAVGGSVEIDTSPIPGKPEETVRKMRVVKAAALSSGQPSGADFAVASAAAQAEAAAMAEIALAQARDFAARYSGEMDAASRAAGPPAATPSSGALSSLRDDGPPPTPFDVIA